MAPFIGSAGWQAALGRNFALGCVVMGPKSKAETVASRKAGAAKMAKALGTTVRLKITPNQLMVIHTPLHESSEWQLLNHYCWTTLSVTAPLAVT